MTKNKSFTLIELLVVIVIIGILAGVIMISTSSSIDKANFAKAQAFSNTVQNELLSNLIHEWTFDEITSNVDQPLVDNYLIKDGWRNADLYSSGGPILRDKADCVYGKCLDFINDSASNLNQIFRSNSVVFSPTFTISYWINRRGCCRYNGGVYTNENCSGFMEIHNVENGNVLLYQGVKSEQFVIYLFFTDSTSKSMSFSIKNISNDWHLVTFSYNDNTKYLKAYLDGNIFHNDIVEASKSIKTSNNTRISIGKYTTYWTKGKVDEFRIYESILSDVQIKQNYIAGLESLYSKGTLSETEFKEKVKKMSSNK